ncbi:MAG: hypothetical protein JO179_11810 [Solirubrobacterales bacterium]|nr:hypothetical protein [Solirubrobacterales bacterium]
MCSHVRARDALEMDVVANRAQGFLTLLGAFPGLEADTQGGVTMAARAFPDQPAPHFGRDRKRRAPDGARFSPAPEAIEPHAETVVDRAPLRDKPPQRARGHDAAAIVRNLADFLEAQA